MDPSSLVFVAVIAMWAAYLVPQWLRRRENLVASRTEDRFSDRARVLSRRRKRRPDRHRSADPLHRPTPAVGLPAVRSPRSQPVRRYSPAALRRRQVLLALLILTALSWGLAALPTVAWWAALPTTGLLLVDLFLLRAAARRRAQRARRAAARLIRPPRRSVPAPPRQGRPSAARPASAPAARPAPAATAVDGLADEPGGDGPAGDASAQLPAENEAEVDDGWVPVPVPPPTYTLKPPAPRPEPPPLDPPAEPVAATEQADGAPAAAHSARDEAGEASRFDLDAALARRRAVNE